MTELPAELPRVAVEYPPAPDFDALRARFRAAVADGSDTLDAYRDWRRAYDDYVAARRDAERPVVELHEWQQTERARLAAESRELASWRDGRMVGDGVRENGYVWPVQQSDYDARLAQWRADLAEYAGQDCGDVEPARVGAVPLHPLAPVTSPPDTTQQPRDFSVELSDAFDATARL